MKKILIVIGDMRIGGAQRSLLSFLKCLEGLKHQYKIDLMVVDPAGEFLHQIPSGIQILEPPTELRWLGTAFGKKLLKEHFSLKCLWGQMVWLLGKKGFPKGWNTQQKLWHCWKKRIPSLPGHYDAAISYIDGFPNYYLIEKVRADKKVLWIHNEYQKLQYDREYDHSFYEQADSIITISQRCKDCIAQAFPEFQSKVHILENITVSQEILEKSRVGEYPEFADYPGLKLLSVGRLNAQKGYDLAIESSVILQKAGVPFLWLVLGEGPDRAQLEAQIASCNMQEHFRLLGSRENPYSYMAACDILVQSSRFEGKSVVLDEAKILCKPVVVTNYTTAGDSVEHGKTGWITDMTPQAVAEGILKLYQDWAQTDAITAHLQSLDKGNEAELQQYIQLMM